MANRTIEEIRAVAKDPAHRRTATARIFLFQDLVEAHRRADQALNDYADDTLDITERLELAKAVRQAEEEMEGAGSEEFTFQSIGTRQWVDLLKEHAPTKEMLERGFYYNQDTFPPVAIAASCIDPVMTAEDVRDLHENLHPAEWRKLWNACVEACEGGGSLPKSSEAGKLLRWSEGFARTPAQEESLDQSSSAE
jgi:hypothetical protein